MVFVAAVRRPVQPPARERLQQLVAALPVFRPEGSRWEAARVQQHLLHRHDVLAVRAELRDDLRHALLQPQQPFFEQEPDRRADDCLRAGEDAIQGLGRGRLLDAALDCVAERAHPSELAVTRHRHLRARQQPLVHVSLRAGEDGLELLGVDARGFGLAFGMLGVEHGVPPSEVESDWKTAHGRWAAPLYSKREKTLC